MGANLQKTRETTPENMRIYVKKKKKNTTF